MPFTKRHLRPRTKRFLYRQLEDQTISAESRKCIADVLEDPKLIEKVNAFCFGLVKKAGKVAVFSAVTNEGIVGGPILDSILAFLAEHWDEILLLIMKLFGL